MENKDKGGGCAAFFVVVIFIAVRLFAFHSGSILHGLGYAAFGAAVVFFIYVCFIRLILIKIKKGK